MGENIAVDMLLLRRLMGVVDRNVPQVNESIMEIIIVVSASSPDDDASLLLRFPSRWYRLSMSLLRVCLRSWIMSWRVATVSASVRCTRMCLG